MRGIFRDQTQLFSYVSPESRVPSGHPLRKIRGLVRDVLRELSRSFAGLYAKDGRPSVPPAQLLSALLSQALYGIRSERQLMEQLNYNLLYRWFVGLSPDDPVWDPTTFTKNRERLQAGEVFEKFMTRLLNHPQVKPLLSDQHFSVDGTLIEAWASQRSFRSKDGSDGDGSDFHGQTRKNDTHQSTTDPDSRLLALLSNFGPGVLANFGPPPVPQPRVTPIGSGGLLWTGEPKWNCSSSSVASMSLVLARSRAWPRSLVFIGALSAGRSRVRCRRSSITLNGPSRSSARSPISLTRFWTRTVTPRANSATRPVAFIAAS
jgi:transposase